MKFTPGPYRTVHGIRKHKEAMFIVAKSPKAFIAKVYGHEGQPVEANAALLAAAPDMLKAIDDYLSNYGCVGNRINLDKLYEIRRGLWSSLMGGN